jgi:hypothetical protein
VGASGSWVIGTNAVAGGYGIHRWTGTNWSAVPGGAMEITLAGIQGKAGLDSALGKPCAPYSEFVTSLFHSVLERQPDQKGLNYWVSCLNNGKSRRWVIAQFFLAQGQSKKKNNRDFVRDAYQAILGREPDSSGQNTWANSLSKHMPRDDMIQYFLHCQEYKQIMANCGL